MQSLTLNNFFVVYLVGHRKSYVLGILLEHSLTAGSCLGLVFLLGPVFENPGELGVIKHSVFDGGLPVHFVHVVVREPVSHRRQQLAQPILVDETAVVVIETTKCIFDDILWVCSLQSLSKECEEHGEVNGAGSLVHHALQVVVCGVFSQRGQHVVEVLLVNEPIPVLVDHVEGLLELLDLVLVEHGEHVGGGSLRALLRRPTTSGGLTRRHLDLCSLRESSK